MTNQCILFFYIALKFEFITLSMMPDKPPPLFTQQGFVGHEGILEVHLRQVVALEGPHRDVAQGDPGGGHRRAGGRLGDADAQAETLDRLRRAGLP